MKHLIVIDGKGEGCDYTIGCNMRWEEVEADNAEQAWEYFLTDYHGVDDFDELLEECDIRESEFDRIRIYEVPKEPLLINYDKWVKTLQLTPDKEKDFEWEEYLRLKNKFDSNMYFGNATPSTDTCGRDLIMSTRMGKQE